MSGFISIADLVDSGGAPLMTDLTFKQFIEIAQGKDSKIVDSAGATAQIGFPENAKDIKTWFVAGIRIDVGAPGLSASIMEAFGQIPQIRLILQPVTREPNGGLKIHDRAAHIIFSFIEKKSQVQETCLVPMLSRVDPDLQPFRAALSDFVVLRDDLAAGRFGGVPIVTTGLLDVHPGLKAPSQKPFRDQLKTILEKHLKSTQVSAMAVMGIPANGPEPWIFVPMQRRSDNGNLEAFLSPALDGQAFEDRAKAQLLRFFGAKKVLPGPRTDNENETMTTCFRLPDARKGVSTAELINAPATAERTIEVTAVIADPKKSHFFNTDCVSCHTETRLLRTKVPGEPIPGIAEAVLPSSRWNVRNFGWGLDSEGFKPTITRRTATETDEVVEAANILLNQ
ncbi:hypothetical protein MAXJ12_36191 [Mesorhizobium alhagi CCNWXJ12-2]|uniref:Cytochrome c domain-containing protein n=2 Tax=Allomesorhizobium alhagi TaxID=475067 RepID=H0I417_9HYPH|nr:hypothetical protein MAXJ12_36191 [Mesorhizobium alhagi CCNWXJ12-2]